MTKDDLKAVMVFLPTVIDVEMNKKTIAKCVDKTVKNAKRGVITIDDFYEFFQQMKGVADTKEIVDDFDNSDKPKSLFGGLVAFAAFAIAACLIFLGTTMKNAIVLIIAGIVSLVFSIYIGLYTAGYSVDLCGESKGTPGEPNKTPGQIAAILFALAVASYAYGIFSGMEDWLEQLTILWLILAALFLSCRCA